MTRIGSPEFAMVHCVRDGGRILEMLRRAVSRYGFRGVKVHGHEAMPTRELCQAARSLHLPVLIDVAGRESVMEMLAPQYPDVSFIVPHLGSFADDWKTHQRVIDQLVRFPNVFTDTSGVRRFDYIVEAARRAGPRKILFGSDGPWLHPGIELYKIRMLGLPRNAEALILGGNAARLIFRSDFASPSCLDNADGFSRRGRETAPRSIGAWNF